MSFIVPGTTVLLTNMVCCFLVFRMLFPNDFIAFLIIDRSIAPVLFCGVPTVTKIKSQSCTTDTSFSICNLFFNPFFKVFSKSGSKNGKTPLDIFLHFSLSTSIPTTLNPFDAKTLVSDRPTNPNPIIAIFI